MLSVGTIVLDCTSIRISRLPTSALILLHLHKKNSAIQYAHQQPLSKGLCQDKGLVLCSTA